MDNRKIIYLDDAIDAVLKLTYADGAYGYTDAKDLVDSLENLPSAHSERLKGHWIFVHPLQEDDGGAYMCSECRTGNWEIDPKRYFFCPYCGADMRTKETDFDYQRAVEQLEHDILYESTFNSDDGSM